MSEDDNNNVSMLDIPCACMAQYDPSDSRAVLNYLLEHTHAKMQIIPCKVTRLFVSSRVHGWKVLFYVKAGSLPHPTGSQLGPNGEMVFWEHCKDGEVLMKEAKTLSMRGCQIVGFNGLKKLHYEEDYLMRALSQADYDGLDQTAKAAVVAVRNNGPPLYLQEDQSARVLYPTAVYKTVCQHCYPSSH